MDPTKHQYTEQEITKIFGGNWVHVLERKAEVMEARAGRRPAREISESMLSPLNKYFPLTKPGCPGKLNPGVLETIR